MLNTSPIAINEPFFIVLAPRHKTCACVKTENDKINKIAVNKQTVFFIFSSPDFGG